VVPYQHVGEYLSALVEPVRHGDFVPILEIETALSFNQPSSFFSTQTLHFLLLQALLPHSICHRRSSLSLLRLEFGALAMSYLA